MTTKEQTIREFFEAYATRMNAALGETPRVNAEDTVSAFAKCFVEASPAGVNCGQNDQSFREQVVKGYEFYRSIGTQSMNILSLTPTPLDAFHTMVKVHWRADYKKKDGSETGIEFDVIYFVQDLNGQLKIFSYITGDEQKAYQDMGLVPDQTGQSATA